MLQRNARPRIRAGVALWLRTPGGRLWGARKSIPVTFIPLFERFLISCRRSRGGFGPRTSPCDRTGWRSSVAVHPLPALQAGTGEASATPVPGGGRYREVGWHPPPLKAVPGARPGPVGRARKGRRGPVFLRCERQRPDAQTIGGVGGIRPA